MCRLIETPIIRDMRQTAAQLGVIESLLLVRERSWTALDQIARLALDGALQTLGVERLPPPLADPREPDPRD